MTAAHADIRVMYVYHAWLGYVGAIRMTLALSVLLFSITLGSNGIGGNA